MALMQDTRAMRRCCCSHTGKKDAAREERQGFDMGGAELASLIWSQGRRDGGRGSWTGKER
jgi:hypothetical protein